MIVRDRDFAMCIAHEEEGQGPSLERLLLDRSFKEAASLLEPGVEIPFAILPNDAAPWLAAWLDKRGLQLDRDGDDWFVTKRGESGADLAARLSVAVHVLLPPVLVAIFALLAGACGYEQPHGKLVTNAGPAFEIILSTFAETAELPPVYLVDADPTCGEMPAYRRGGDGRCMGGEQIPGVGIYLVRRPEALFMDHFPHEVRHLTGHRHCAEEGCGFESAADLDALNRARWALRFIDANRIETE